MAETPETPTPSLAAAAGYPCDVNDSVLVLVGRALIAAGWTPEEEA